MLCYTWRYWYCSRATSLSDVINCFLLVALTHHTMASVCFVLLIDYSPNSAVLDWHWIAHAVLSWNPLSLSAFTQINTSISVTECHLPSIITNFVLDKGLLPALTQTVKWGGFAEARHHTFSTKCGNSEEGNVRSHFEGLPLPISH